MLLRRKTGWLALVAAFALGCGRLLGCEADSESQAEEADKAAEPAPVKDSITLRFRPLDKLTRREHWVYDLAVPGSGLGRNALSFDVSLLAKLDQDTYAVRYSTRAHAMFRDRKPIAAPSLVGTKLTYTYRHDHSLVGEVAADAASPLLAAATKLVAQLARFGTLIEYPDQAVAAGDSWSIEPRQLVIAPGLEATLRPTYTLEAIETRPERTARIATDIQVDVVPLPVAEGITIEGGGTASGSMHVRLRDGVLVEARSVMHFSQEITVQGSEILGYREFSATGHVWTSATSTLGSANTVTPEPNLAAEPYTIDEPEHDPECDLAVASAIQRLRSSPAQRRLYPLPARRGVTIPAVAGGALLEEPGIALFVSADGKQLELDGRAIETKNLASTLRAFDRKVVYLYADAALTLERLRPLLALITPKNPLRLAVRDATHAPGAPKTLRWLEERLQTAAAATTLEEREHKLYELLNAHLVLCEPALLAVANAATHEEAFHTLANDVLGKFLECGCTATNLEGIETTFEAILGPPDVRALPFPHALDPALPPTLTLGELAKQLAAARPRPSP